MGGAPGDGGYAANSKIPRVGASKGAAPSAAPEERGGGASMAPPLVGIAVVAVVFMAGLVTRAWGRRRFGGGAGALVSV